MIFAAQQLLKRVILQGDIGRFVFTETCHVTHPSSAHIGRLAFKIGFQHQVGHRPTVRPHMVSEIIELRKNKIGIA